MGKSAEQIVTLYRQRKTAKGPLLARMEDVRRHYNGDVVVPLPELDRAERPAVANLLAQGLDQSAMRMASVMPDVNYPPDRPGFKNSEEVARIKRKANLAWWHANRMRTKHRRRTRHLLGYSTSPVIIRPDMKREMPLWHVRNPLTTFEAPAADPDDICPPDCIFTFPRSKRWLMQNYPEQTAFLYGMKDAEQDDVFDILEYVDDREHTLVACGKERDPYDDGRDAYFDAVPLMSIENRAGICPVVIPGRITLDRLQGQFDGILGMYQMQARLMALSVIATEKGIFPERYLVSRQGELASFVTGPFDGRTGKISIVKGGDIKDVALNPGFMTNPTIDRIERSERLTGGIPQEFGGESTSNIRTGARGDAVLSAVVDFPIQEGQEAFAAALEEENRRAIAIDKAYFNKPKSFYVNFGKTKGKVDYTPGVHFTNDTNFVSYSHAGADVNNLVIGLGQRLGIGTMSTRTAQELDPFIDDPELEHDRSVAEALERSLLASIEQQAVAGAIAPVDLARIMELVRTNKRDLAQAVEQAQREAQERQASAGEPGAPDGPVDPGSPEAKPGLQGGPEGAGAPAVEGPNASTQNLSQLLSNLRRPQMTVGGA
jgi:hypothetical protein